MIVLALDTAQGACSAAVLDGERVLAAGSEPMTRGHQERLAPMVQALMVQAGIAFPALERIAVTVGPGSFTGLRVGIATATPGREECVRPPNLWRNLSISPSMI